MKTVETIKEGKNFTVVNVGKLSGIKDYVLPLGNIEIPGKVFVGGALHATGSEPDRTVVSCISTGITRNSTSF